MLHPERLAAKVYHAMLTEMAEAQQEVVKIDALVARFGDKALSPWHTKMGMTRLGLRDASKDIARDRERHLERIAELTETLEMFEEVFAKQEEADIEALAEFLRERVHKKGGD